MFTLKRKAKLVIVIFVVLVFIMIGYGLIIYIKFAGKDCNWRPPNDYMGNCSAIAGYYFDGNDCVDLGKCINEDGWGLVEKGVLFESPRECLLFATKCKLLK